MISIPHASLLEALKTANSLDLTIGADYEIVPPSTLKVKPSAIDRLLRADLLSEMIEPTPEIPRLPERIDRQINLQGQYALDAAQIESSFAAAYEAANTDRDRSIALQSRNLARQTLRVALVSPIAQADVISGSTLVYGGSFEDCRCLEEPDGRKYTVQTLIHFSHPSSPEELHLRECRVIADRIIRYWIPGLEDGIWIAQNEPIKRLDATGWREMLRQRLQAQHSILGTTAE